MERNTFPEQQVRQLFEQFDLLQADVTANDDVDQALMKAFGIIGPPAILFFNNAGEEMKAYRLVGYFEAEEFTCRRCLSLSEPDSTDHGRRGLAGRRCRVFCGKVHGPRQGSGCGTAQDAGGGGSAGQKAPGFLAPEH